MPRPGGVVSGSLYSRDLTTERGCGMKAGLLLGCWGSAGVLDCTAEDVLGRGSLIESCEFVMESLWHLSVICSVGVLEVLR